MYMLSPINYLRIYLGSEYPEDRGVLWKKAFLEISQNLQKNICAIVSFLIKLQSEYRGSKEFNTLL